MLDTTQRVELSKPLGDARDHVELIETQRAVVAVGRVVDALDVHTRRLLHHEAVELRKFFSHVSIIQKAETQ